MQPKSLIKLKIILVLILNLFRYCLIVLKYFFRHVDLLHYL